MAREVMNDIFPAKKKVLDQKLISKRLDQLRPILANAVVGDFSKDLKIPDVDDEFTELFVGVQTMVEVIREQIQELQEHNQSLETDAAQKAAALEEAQALTHLGSWQWDIATNIISWSDELYRMYGLKPQERQVSFNEFLLLIHPEDRDQVSEVVSTSFKTGKPFEFEHRIILPDGKERILHGMGKVVSDAAGSPLRMLGTSQDITEQKQLERAKDEFLSLVSHQLRTPLTVTKLYSGMLAENVAGELNPQQEDYVHRIFEASVRMISLVGDILNISRIELGRVKVQPAPTDVNVLIQSHLNELALIAKEKGIELTFTPDTHVSKIPLDIDVFNLILENLMVNAIRYTRPNEGKVQVTFKQNKEGYRLKVSDNGIGIPEAAHGHIFSRFYRASNAVKFDTEGTGLGLYLIKLVCDVIGASIWFESQNNKGSQFSVQFPLGGMGEKEGELTLE